MDDSFSNFTDPSTWRSSYVASKAVERFATLPRDDIGRNISALFGSDEENAEDYVQGLLFISGLVLVFFLVWGLILLVFMCCGRERVGFLSGSTFVLEDASEEDEDGEIDYRDKWNSRIGVTRIIFLLSGSICIVFRFLLVTEGINNLQTSINILDYNAVELDAIATLTFFQLRDKVEDSLRPLKDLRFDLLVELEMENFCPADPTMQNSQSAGDLRPSVEEARRLLTGIDDFREEDLADISKALTEASKGAQNTHEVTSEIDFTNWTALAFSVPHILFPSLMMGATVMAHYDLAFPVLSCFINWVALPIFIFLTVLSVLTSSLLLVGGGANSDFCLPAGNGSSPQDTILQLLSLEGFSSDTYVHMLGNYYAGQCLSEDPRQDVLAFLADLRSNKASLVSLQNELMTDIAQTELSLNCNRSFDQVQLYLLEMQNILETIIEGLSASLTLISCPRIVPLYTSTFHRGICQYSPKGVFWVFICALIVAFFGMIMITTRSSYKVTMVEDIQLNTSDVYDEDANNDVDDEIEELEPNLEHYYADIALTKST